MKTKVRFSKLNLNLSAIKPFKGIKIIARLPAEEMKTMNLKRIALIQR
jgi:hypothetical protein